jgi:hypothetical protein
MRPISFQLIVCGLIVCGRISDIYIKNIQSVQRFEALDLIACAIPTIEELRAAASIRGEI